MPILGLFDHLIALCLACGVGVLEGFPHPQPLSQGERGDPPFALWTKGWGVVLSLSKGVVLSLSKGEGTRVDPQRSLLLRKEP